MNKPRARRKWDYRELVENLTAFTHNPRDKARMLEKQQERIVAELASPSDKLHQRMLPLSGRLESIARWKMSCAAAGISNGDYTCWTQMRHGLELASWSARIRHALIDKQLSWDSNPMTTSITYSTESHTLLQAIGIGDVSFSHGFGQHLVKNLRRNGGHKVFFYTEPLRPFSLRLYSTWIGEDLKFPNDVPNPCGPYQQVFDTWNSPSDLSVAVHDICELHCEESFDTSHFPMFVYPPYQVFPVEILAINRVRQDLGLELPQVNHPLLQAAFMNPPMQIPHAKDELLERVIAFVSKDFPGISLEHPWEC